MTVRSRKRKDHNGVVRQTWIVDIDYQYPDGQRERVRKKSPVQTRRGSEQYEREIRISLAAGTYKQAKEMLTFDAWFHGRFWTEWVVGRDNKPSERESKKSIYRVHLEPVFGSILITEIDDGMVARFRAQLVSSKRSKKTMNNVLAVLSKALKYAENVRVIERAPQIGLFRVERPDIVCWSFEDYARLLATAQQTDPSWYLAFCLAGEAGMRIGEIRALDWKRDVDLVAKTITVNRQIRHGDLTTPKGGRRRTVPMTARLESALRSLDQIRAGFVVRKLDGAGQTDNETKYWCYRICSLAGLPKRGWHILRHSFGTHAARFGVNPWSLMLWMGHRRMEETMLYVNLAHSHRRPIPQSILDIGDTLTDPDERILAMLSARETASGTLAAPSEIGDAVKQ